MGAVFEELIRKFAELSHETAGEHFTPRDAIRLMGNLLFGAWRCQPWFLVFAPAWGFAMSSLVFGFRPALGRKPRNMSLVDPAYTRCATVG